MIESAELSARWARVRQMLTEQDLDVVIAIDWSRDEILLGNQRWLTGFAPIGGPAAALVFRDGHVEVASARAGLLAAQFYKERGLPIETVAGFSPALLAERLAKSAARRVGFAEEGSFPFTLASAILALPTSPALVDVSAAFMRLRMVKSDAEIAAVRQSCAIADTVWGNLTDIFKIGRSFSQILADVDHLVRLEGGEGGFHLVGRLPYLGIPVEGLADPEQIRRGERYLMEISPRYQGYYSQLTSPLTSIPADDLARQAFSDIVDAKKLAQPLMAPGADLSEVAAEVANFLSERGHTMASRSLGHFCGMALEEPRHNPANPFLLEKGMTLIFHPVLTSPMLNSFMRADTYLITEAGAERLNKYDGGVLEIA